MLKECLYFRYRQSSCRARLHNPIDNEDERHYVVKQAHSHAPDSRKLGKKKVMTKIKQLSKTTKKSTNDIISDSLKDVKKSTAAVIPPRVQLKNTVFRARHNPAIAQNPLKLSDLQLTAEFCKTESGENFLLYDSETTTLENGNESRLVMFGTKSNMDFLALCPEIFMDGTFTVTPKLFNQLYTIHGKH